MKNFRYFILTSFCLLLSYSNLFSQKSLSPVNIKETLSKFPKQEDYPNAEAIVLYRYNITEMLNDGSIRDIEVNRYKIFNERGYDLATESIEYKEGFSNVKILFANTIKPDGTIIPLNMKDINDSSPYSDYSLYSDIKVKKFTMPAIEPNCIIEYAYEKINTRPVLSYDLYGKFFMNGYLPVKEEILEIIIPHGRDAKFAYFKTDIKPKIDNFENKTKYTYKFHSSPEIISEPQMPDREDREVFPQFHFWTLNSWHIISKWYAGLIKEQMQSNTELIQFTKELIKNKESDEEKIREIFYFVSQRVRYISIPLGQHSHKPYAAYDVFNKRYGDCKDKTTLLLTMLEIAGIEGMPGLVPGNDFFDESIPTMHVFNHVIAVVHKKGGSYYWLDATNETAAFTSVPFSKSKSVLLVKTDGSYKIVKTPKLDDKVDYISSSEVYRVNDDGNVIVEFTLCYYGFSAISSRLKFKYMSPEKRKQIFESLRIEDSNYELINLDKYEMPFIIKINGIMRNKIQIVSEDLMILSDVINFPSYDKLISSKTRKFPILFDESNLYKIKEIYYFPSGYKIKKLPVDYKVEDKYNRTQIKYKFENNVFSIEMEKKDYNYKIEPNDFEAFKKDSLGRQKYIKNHSNILFEKK